MCTNYRGSLFSAYGKNKKSWLLMGYSAVSLSLPKSELKSSLEQFSSLREWPKNMKDLQSESTLAQPIHV